MAGKRPERRRHRRCRCRIEPKPRTESTSGASPTARDFRQVSWPLPWRRSASPCLPACFSRYRADRTIRPCGFFGGEDGQLGKTPRSVARTAKSKGWRLRPGNAHRRRRRDRHDADRRWLRQAVLKRIQSVDRSASVPCLMRVFDPEPPIPGDLHQRIGLPPVTAIVVPET